MDTSTLNVKPKRRFLVGVICCCIVLCSVTVFLGLQRSFAAGKAENVVSALCLEITCSVSLNHRTIVRPVDLHHSFADNVCYLQAIGKSCCVISHPSPAAAITIFGDIQHQNLEGW